MGDYSELRRIAEAATPGEWRNCGHDRGGCSCGFVWAVHSDAPVAEAVVGSWGDTWPALRVGENGELEAYMANCYYGEVRPDQGKANAAFIAAASPSVVLALLDEIAALRSTTPGAP